MVKIVDWLDKCPDYIRASWKASEPNTDSSTVTWDLQVFLCLKRHLNKEHTFCTLVSVTDPHRRPFFSVFFGSLQNNILLYNQALIKGGSTCCIIQSRVCKIAKGSTSTPLPCNINTAWRSGRELTVDSWHCGIVLLKKTSNHILASRWLSQPSIILCDNLTRTNYQYFNASLFYCKGGIL